MNPPPPSLPPASPHSGTPQLNEGWHHREATELLQASGSSTAGLSKAEAAQRLQEKGPNTLTEGKRIGALQILLNQFKSIIIWILILAGIASGVMGETMDAVAILAIVALNATIGWYQEFSAEKSVASLRKLTAPQARVRRQDQVLMVAAAELVVGDILMLDAGDVVAADGRLLEAHSLRCVEAALTGEAAAVSKQSAVLPKPNTPLGDRTNMIFTGTHVAAGTGEALIVATGMQTELGRIAGMITEATAEEETPLQTRLNSFGRVLLWATLVIVALLFGLGLWRGTALAELFLTSISLAVAAVPEGLPAVVTVALSLGVLRMARRNALLRKLSAVETLGSTSVICTDKTGTLTLGEMTARTLHVAGQDYEITGDGYGPTGEILQAGKPVPNEQRASLNELARVLVGGNYARIVKEDDTWKTIGDPTEGALLVAGTKAGAEPAQVERDWPKHASFPFDSDRKRGSIVRRKADGGFRVFVNGAPGPLLAQCTQLFLGPGIRPLTQKDREQLLAVIRGQATRALRVLGSAYRDFDADTTSLPSAEALEKDLVFVGLTGMYDPPRAEAKASIAACHAAGIRVVMITGDHPETARAIAQEIGIAQKTDLAVSGTELDAFSDEDLRRRSPRIAVYARVTAEHKLRMQMGQSSP